MQHNFINRIDAGYKNSKKFIEILNKENYRILLIELIGPIKCNVKAGKLANIY